MNQREIELLWVKGGLPDVTYKFSDEVRMKSGERADEVGRIVALYKLEPCPHYVIEFPDGTSANAVQAEVERTSL